MPCSILNLNKLSWLPLFTKPRVEFTSPRAASIWRNVSVSLSPEQLPVRPAVPRWLVVCYTLWFCGRQPHWEAGVQHHCRTEALYPHRWVSSPFTWVGKWKGSSSWSICLFTTYTFAIKYCFLLHSVNIQRLKRPHRLSAGMLLPAAFFVAVAYAGCSHILTVTFLTLSTTTGGTSASGVFINQIDIAPRWVLPSLLSLQSRNIQLTAVWEA